MPVAAMEISFSYGAETFGPYVADRWDTEISRRGCKQAYREHPRARHAFDADDRTT
jgi:hypothetical protein